MNNKLLLTIALAVPALGFAGAVNGQYTWTGATGTDWMDSDNWDQSNYPGELDDGAEVIIPGVANQPSLSDALDFAIDSLTIEKDATVRILAMGVLEVRDLEIEADSDSSFGILELDDSTSEVVVHGTVIVQAALDGSTPVQALINIEAGTLVLTGEDAEHAIGGALNLLGSSSRVLIESDMQFKPFSTFDPGAIRGFDEAASVELVNGVTVESSIAITGSMILAPEPAAAATFINQEEVRADLVNLTLELAPNLALEDGSSPYGAWRSSADGAVLLFREDAVSLGGPMEITNDGIISVGDDVTVATTGALENCNGSDWTIEVGSGAFFIAWLSSPSQQVLVGQDTYDTNDVTCP